MGNLEDVAEKIRRLRNERRNLLQEIEGVKKLADSEATALESEVSMLRERLRIEEQKKLTDSKTEASENAVSMSHETPRTEELKKLTYSEAAALESEVSMLREAVKDLWMDLSPNEPREEADLKKKSRWNFFGRHF